MPITSIRKRILDEAASDSRVLLPAALASLALVSAVAFLSGESRPVAQEQAGQIRETRADFAGTAPPTCGPHDISLGMLQGDPYGFYSFNRDDELTRAREECETSTASLAPPR